MEQQIIDILKDKRPNLHQKKHQDLRVSSKKYYEKYGIRRFRRFK